MISVVMTTYNGSKYIDLQLESILSQTMIPDEIVIVDDCSTDDTFSKLIEYEKKYLNIEWILEKNEKNLGWKKNFAKAICLSHGDIIFLSDQDDYWQLDKIEIMQKTILENTNIKVLAAKYRTYDRARFRPNNRNEQDSRGSKNVIQCIFDDHFYMTHYPGCNIAITKEMRGWFEQRYWDGEQPHDEYLWTIGKLFDVAFVLDYDVLCYLRHADAATADKGHSRDKRLKLLTEKMYCIETVESILADFPIPNKEKKQDIVLNSYTFIGDRIQLLEKKSILLAMKLLKNIKRYERVSYYISDLYSTWMK